MTVRTIGPAGAGLWDRIADAFTDRGYVSPWRDLARPSQILPSLAEGWLIWLFMAGRGAGKTRAAAEAVAELMRRYPGCRVALVAQTFADGRDTMVEGESGLLSVIDASELRGGSVDTAWNRSMGELFLANGSSAKVYSSEKPRKLRGPQFHVAWGDEIATWQDANKDPGQIDTTWSNLMLGLRLPRRPGWPLDYRPRCIVTTTPRRVALLKVAPAVAVEDPHRAGITQMPAARVRITAGTTDENIDNLAGEFVDAVVRPLRGTRLGRQEIQGELLDDVQGALLLQAHIDRARVARQDVPRLASTVVAVDPAVSSTDDSDETGIVVVGVDDRAEGYVLADESGRYSPEEWATKVWLAALAWEADAVVVEDNQGGDMVETTLKAAWLDLQRQAQVRGQDMPGRPAVVRVHPSGAMQGKWLRAQPVALLYEQAPGRIHHVGMHPRLEDQATSWTGSRDEASPDRVDALVHGLSWLLFPKRRKLPKGAKAPAQVNRSRWGAGARR